MNIKTKFNESDKAIPILKVKMAHFTTCKVCEGNGSLFVDRINSTINCPSCKGSGKIRGIKRDIWVVKSGLLSEIKQIIIDINQTTKPSLKIKYKIKLGFNETWDESDLFRTKVAAQKECDRRNLLIEKLKLLSL